MFKTTTRFLSSLLISCLVLTGIAFAGNYKNIVSSNGASFAGSIDTVPDNYFIAHDTTTQNIVTPGTFQTITFNTNDVLNGWTHTVGTDAFVAPETALYNISGFIQINKTAGGSSLFEFRLTANGTPVGTVFAETLVTNGEIKNVSASTPFPLTAGVTYRIEWTAGVNSQVVAPTTIGSTKSAAFSIFKIN